MALSRLGAILALGLTYAVCVVSAATTTVRVSATASHPIPSTLYGQMFEDINHSGDGGLYAEMLQNRAFQQVTANTAAALNAWASVGSATIAVVADSTPVSSALPNSLKLTVPSTASGKVGFSNSGYFGIKVDSAWTYTASFFYKLPRAGSLTATIALQSISGTVLAQRTATLSSTSWKQVTLTLKPTASVSTASNLFTVTFDGAAAKGKTINFAMFSLMPPTFKGRKNGMRVDVAEALAAMRPGFFRLPGGNNLEGQTVATRWQWNTTVGPLVNRPGRVGDWGYANTDGLGLMEYLEWCEDAGMEAILAVWDGFALGGATVPDAQLAPYIQQAIDQINFAVGDPTKSAPAALRSSLGHPAPFPVHHVEIGNEDFISSTASSTAASYRWRDFFGNLTTAFPDLRFLATTQPPVRGGPTLTPKPQEYDLHDYNTPTWFANNSFLYDDFKRDGTLYFHGEFAAISTNSSDIFGSVSDGRLLFPTMQSAAGEAAFMTGLERNSDIVFAASYAPLLQNVASTQWTPDLVSFDAMNVYLSTSYYVQKLFSLNKGDEYLPSTLPTKTGSLFWSITRRRATNEVLFKISNIDTNPAPLAFQLPFGTVASTGTAQILSGATNASNTPTAPNTVVPKNSTFAVHGKTVQFTAPAMSVSVLTVVAH